MTTPSFRQTPRTPPSASIKDAAPKKAPNPVDVHVGSRVRMRRKMLAMSQGKLARALGLTFQQVQKYEKGMNRIGGSRLHQMSHILQVPVAFFFEDAPGTSSAFKSNEAALMPGHVDDFVSSSEGLRLIGAFKRIESVTLRRRIASLVQEIADCE
jgi:transcriptional regulator with XRE-family HTH domain